MGTKVIVAEYEAVGGPPVALRGVDDFKAGPTDAGSYVMAYCGKHSSVRYPDWSGIPWNTPIRDDGREIWVRRDGRWKALSSITKLTRVDVLSRSADLNGVRSVPATWVFNDFGHITCYYFRDLNANRRLDSGEHVHGEFFHPTPDSEARSAKREEVILVESHGCIHVKPDDIDDMMRRGFMKKGNLVFIHKYGQTAPSGPRAAGKGPYEVHFYPSARRIVIRSDAQH